MKTSWFTCRRCTKYVYIYIYFHIHIFDFPFGFCFFSIYGINISAFTVWHKKDDEFFFTMVFDRR